MWNLGGLTFDGGADAGVEAGAGDPGLTAAVVLGAKSAFNVLSMLANCTVYTGHTIPSRFIPQQSLTNC